MDPYFIENNKLVTHVKQNRDNIDAFDEKHYSFKELFPEL